MIPVFRDLQLTVFYKSNSFKRTNWKQNRLEIGFNKSKKKPKPFKGRKNKFDYFILHVYIRILDT